LKRKKRHSNNLRVLPSRFLQVDTYDSVIAIKKTIRLGIYTNGIRLDSGDLYYLSVGSRTLLDIATGYKDTKKMASGDLKGYAIRDLVARAAPIGAFGVGIELSTSKDDPAMNVVYKLVAVIIHSMQEEEGNKRNESG
jgi:nicotinate phosphoribosyltransferase